MSDFTLSDGLKFKDEVEKNAHFQEEISTIHGFLEWLDTQGIQLHKYDSPDSNWTSRIMESDTNLINRYVGIDPKELEKNRSDLLKKQRELNDC